MGFDLFGNIASAIAAPQALKRQEAAIHNAQNTQQQQYATNQGYYQPYYNAGTSALGQLSTNLQNGAYNVNVTPQSLQNDPGYQFQLQQGMQALQRSAAAQGNLGSGGFAKALDNYSQGLASTQYQNAWNRQFQQNQFNYNSLAGLAGMGERSAGNLAGLGERYGNTMAGYDVDLGNARAAERMSMAQGYGGAADGALGIGLSAATGMPGLMGGGGGGGQGLSAGNPYSMAPLDGGYGYGGYGGASQSLGSIGYAPSIPAQGYSGPMAAGGYGGYGASDPLGGYGNGGPYSLIPPQYGGSY